MAKLEFGVRQGLAVDMQWDQRINDLRYQQQQMQQAQIQGQAKAKMYADDMQHANAMNNFDNPRVKQYAQVKIKEIGKFVNENPDWESNVAKRGMYTQMVSELKNNPELNRGLQSDENWKAAQKDMSDVKNADLDFSDTKTQWDNYNKFGNQFGEKAAEKEGARQFVYNSPQSDIDVIQDALKTGQTLGTTDYATGGGFGAKITKVDDKKIKDVALSKFEGPQRRSYENAWKNLSPEQQSFYGNDKYHWAEELVRAGTDVKKEAGQYIYPSKGSGSSGSGGDTTETKSLYASLKDIRQNETVAIQQDYVKTISPIVKNAQGKGTLTTSDMLRYKVSPKGDGQYVYRTLSGYKGQELNGYETGNYMNDYTGRGMIELVVDLPMSPELTNPQNGLFQDDAIWGKNYVPRQGMENQVSAEKTESGDWVAKMKVWVPARLNKYNGQEFDNTALGQSASNKSTNERDQMEASAKIESKIRSYEAQGYTFKGVNPQTGKFGFEKGNTIIER